MMPLYGGRFMNWSDFDLYLHPNALHSGPQTFEIVQVVVQEIRANGRTTRRLALRFKETDKKLLLSSRHRRALAAHFGDDVSACVGRRIALDAVPTIGNGATHYRIDLTPVPETPHPSNGGYDPVLTYALHVGKLPEAARNALRLAKGDVHLARLLLEEE